MKPTIRSGISSFPIFNERYFFSIRRHNFAGETLGTDFRLCFLNFEPSLCSVSRHFLASSRFDSLSSGKKSNAQTLSEWWRMPPRKERCGGNVLPIYSFAILHCLRKFTFYFLNGIIDLNKYTNFSNAHLLRSCGSVWNNENQLEH